MPESPERGGLYFLAWTTTPWTLPANTALAVGKNIRYVVVRTFNPYTFLPVQVVLAKELVFSKVGFNMKELNSLVIYGYLNTTQRRWRALQSILSLYI